MIRILFNDGSVLEPKEYTMASPIVTFKTKSKPNTSGFRLEKNGVVTFSYPLFNTVYRVLEDGYQLSCDGSVYVEPTPEPEPKPVPSELVIDDMVITVFDFAGTSFKSTLRADEAAELFSGVTEYKVNDVTYEHLSFVSVTEIEGYSLVTFRQKSDIELRLEALEEMSSENDVAITEVAELVNENDIAISELAEIVSGLME